MSLYKNGFKKTEKLGKLSILHSSSHCQYGCMLRKVTEMI